MTLTQINNLFEAVAAGTLGVHSYWFGWPSDRVRSRTTADDSEYTANYPRLLFAVPEMSQNTIQNTDTYTVQLFFDDLLGYNDDGTPDHQTQLQKWNNLMGISIAWLKTLQGTLPSLRPDGVQIIGEPRFILDSFSGQQRLITVIINLTIATKTNCGTLLDFPAVISGGLTWPPINQVNGDWVKADAEYLNTTSNVLPWNEFKPLTGANVTVTMNGTLLASDLYSIQANSITINPATHTNGNDYAVIAIWTL